MIEVSFGILLAAICSFVRKYVMIIVTSLTGSLLLFYSFGFAIGVLGNFFDVLERIKSGMPLVS